MKRGMGPGDVFLLSAEPLAGGETVGTADLSLTAVRMLREEGERRGCSAEDLAVLLLDTVARDNLFAAVLDQ